ncbi:MAG: hypothetical protein WCD53_00875 [Microcoleus sp.]
MTVNLMILALIALYIKSVGIGINITRNQETAMPLDYNIILG